MLFGRSKTKLGIDIGTSTLKVAQIKDENGKHLLQTYGVVNVSRQNLKMDSDVISETALVLKELLDKAHVTTKRIIASLPSNVVFVSAIEIPAMSDKELKSAIEWEARRYVPLPLEEVTLSWSVVTSPENPSKFKVLITAVPTTVIKNYLKMFNLAGLEPLALEIEALALIRSLVGVAQDSLIIIDIGARNTSVNLVDKGFLKISRNLSVGGDTMTSGIAKNLNISMLRAEQFKIDLGLSAEMEQIPQVMKQTIDAIKTETGQLIKIFESGGGEVKQVIFAGSGSKLPGLTKYFSDLGLDTSIGNPLKFIEYNDSIKNNLEKVSAGLAVALGLAMRE